MITTIKATTKRQLLNIAMSGLKSMALAYIKKNPDCRMCDISRGAFGAVDHKQMLASVIVRQLVDDLSVIKYQQAKTFENEQGLIEFVKDENGKVVRHKHYVYLSNLDTI